MLSMLSLNSRSCDFTSSVMAVSLEHVFKLPPIIRARIPHVMEVLLADLGARDV